MLFRSSYEIVTNESWQKVKKSEPLYLAPPSELFGKVEQLKIEKAELIEYARKLHYALFDISLSKYGYGCSPKLAQDALSMSKPKCMEN